MPAWPTANLPTPDVSVATTLDPVLRAEYDSGYVHTRSRYNRPRAQYTLHYPYLTDLQKGTLFNFVHDTLRGGALTCTWTHPTLLTNYAKMAVEVEDAYVVHAKVLGAEGVGGSIASVTVTLTERF